MECVLKSGDAPVILKSVYTSEINVENRLSVLCRCFFFIDRERERDVGLSVYESTYVWGGYFLSASTLTPA